MELSRQMVIPAALQRSDSDDEDGLVEKTPKRGSFFLQQCKRKISFLDASIDELISFRDRIGRILKHSQSPSA